MQREGIDNFERKSRLPRQKSDLSRQNSGTLEKNSETEFWLNLFPEDKVNISGKSKLEMVLKT